MSASRFSRPDNGDYYVEPWSETFLQGDLFAEVPFALPAPPDAVIVHEGQQRFVSGPFDSGVGMLTSPSCVIAAQGASAGSGVYAHPVRTLVPVRPVQELVAAGDIPEHNLGHLRSDRLRRYLYVPAGPSWPESAALLYMPTSLHHDVIADCRVAQLTGSAFWHLRVKLMVYDGGFLVDPGELGPVPAPEDRTS